MNLLNKYLLFLSFIFWLPIFAMDAPLVDEGPPVKKQKSEEMQHQNSVVPTLLELCTNKVAQRYSKMSLQEFFKNQPDIPEELKLLISRKIIEPKIVEKIFQHTMSCLELCGHTDRIVTTAFHPDSSRLITGSYDGIVRIWDTKTGKCLVFFDEYPKAISSVAFSPDGTQIAAGIVDDTIDGTIRIWDTNTGDCLHKFNHIDCVELVAFSPDGKHIASAYNGVKIWNLEIEKCIYTLDGSPGMINTMAYSPDGAFLITGSFAGTVKVWDAQTGNCLHTLNDHTGKIYSIAFNPDSSCFATASKDCMVRIWDLQTGNCKHSLDHENEICSVTFHPNGSVIATGSDNTIATIWDVQTGDCLQEFGHNDRVNSVSFSWNGFYLITASADGNAKIWDMQTGKCVRTLKHSPEVCFASFSPDGFQVLTINSLEDDEDGVYSAKLRDFKTFNHVYRFLTRDHHLHANHLTIGQALLLKGWLNDSIDLKKPQIKKVFDSLPNEIKEIIEQEPQKLAEQTGSCKHEREETKEDKKDLQKLEPANKKQKKE